MAIKKLKVTSWGVGIDDYEGRVKKDGKDQKFYTAWRAMLQRCYDPKSHIKHPSYRGCTVCEEWQRLTNYKRFYDEHYVEGWAMDKDLLVKGNKLYSPDTCCFVPPEINSFLTDRKLHMGEYPPGVCWHSQRKCFYSQIQFMGKRVYLGIFTTPRDAFYAYKAAKEMMAKFLAEKYKEQLDPRAYDALYQFKVEYTV